MTASIDATECNSPCTEIFVACVKATTILGIFCCVAHIFESYFGLAQNGACSYSGADDSDETIYTPIIFTDNTSQVVSREDSDFVTFAVDQVLYAETAVEEKEEEVERKTEPQDATIEAEETSQFVIGAEDLIDHVNRMIG